jgi:hypothetical protein
MHSFVTALEFHSFSLARQTDSMGETLRFVLLSTPGKTLGERKPCLR